MESFGERLNRLMKSAGLNDSNMAFLLGVSGQRLENLLTGYSDADINLITRVAEIFGVSCAYAAGRSDDMKVEEPDNAKEIFVAERLSPVDGIMMQKDVLGMIYIDREKMHGKDYMGLVMKDDGMVKARIFKGDTLVVRRQQFANNGDVVVAMMDDGDYIVRRYNRKGNIVILTAEGDAMKYPPLKIDTTETKFNIIGKIDEVRISF